MIFRAVWPITNPHAAISTLMREAGQDLPALKAQAHATTIGPGRYSIAHSANIPGSGRITEWCLLYEAPARPAHTAHRGAA
ncbi:hypothetical protein [Nocardioides speluncae]|uniref:hypothetical protein n=1 Tax=Nocardioides speluncae TaxID=2670337 RepID=UPI000D68FE75|nr:hypothetical protein [Nocardioides speluncae]